jgi:hypothetical protein
MSDDFKKRIQSIIETQHAKDWKKIQRLQAGTKNDDPEKRVGAECLAWMRSNNWDVDIFEAKATRTAGGGFHASSMPAGVSDCMGISPIGEALYVEFKAPGKRSTFNTSKGSKQRSFLLKKINHYAFGCVVDSKQLLEKTYKEYTEIKNLKGRCAAKFYLLHALPKRRKAAVEKHQ